MNVLFIGLGGAGQRHLRNLLFLFPDAQISALRYKNRNFEITKNLIADYHTNIISKYNIKIIESFDDIHKIKPDFAIVSNPTSKHLDVSEKLVDLDTPHILKNHMP